VLILGLTKTTLLDYPGKVAGTIFTGGCNFACPFCHNGELVKGIDAMPPINEEEIFDFLKRRRGVLEGICISGGEPTLQKDIIDFAAKVKALGYQIKLDTNGTNYKIVEELSNRKLIDYVAMDIKNTPKKYFTTAGIDDNKILWEEINKTIDFLSQGKIMHEFRTTVVKQLHEKEDLLFIAGLLDKKGKWFIQSYKDSPSVIQKGLSAYSDDELKDIYSEIKKINHDAYLRGIQ